MRIIKVSSELALILFAALTILFLYLMSKYGTYILFGVVCVVCYKLATWKRQYH